MSRGLGDVYKRQLHDRVYEVMKSRSHLSDYEYIRYERKNVM